MVLAWVNKARGRGVVAGSGMGELGEGQGEVQLVLAWVN
jgi:hypothetical protein